MVAIVKRKEDFKQKTKSERAEVKRRKLNLDIKFQNKTIIHLRSESDNPTDVTHKKQPTQQEKIDRKYGTKK